MKMQWKMRPLDNPNAGNPNAGDPNMSNSKADKPDLGNHNDVTDTDPIQNAYKKTGVTAKSSDSKVRPLAPSDKTKNSKFEFPNDDLMNDVTLESTSETSFFETAHKSVGQQSDNSLALNKIQDELAGLRNIMEAPLMQFSWGETDRVQPLYASLLKQLMTLGLSSKLSQAIAKNLAKDGLTKHSWLESLNHLAELVPVNDEDIIADGGIVSLVGPTGVGKTTTIAKLAARFALKYGRRGVTLITTDNYRIGAHEQLRSYGRILGIPVHVASDSNELKALLKEAKEHSGEHQLTLIDTAGVSQKDIKLTEQITSLDIHGIDIKNYLVLSATGQMNLQDEVVKAFSTVNLSGCVITKIDEAASLGEIMSVLIQHNLPISFVCDGQKVPDDIHRARGKLLVKEAIKLMRDLNKSLSDEELAYTFGGVVNNAKF